MSALIRIAEEGIGKKKKSASCGFAAGRNFVVHDFEYSEVAIKVSERSGSVADGFEYSEFAERIFKCSGTDEHGERPLRHAEEDGVSAVC